MLKLNGAARAAPEELVHPSQPAAFISAMGAMWEVAMTSSHSLTVHTCDGLPADPEERKEMILRLTADFLTRFESGLKPKRLGLWKKYGLNPPDNLDKIHIVRALDESIISQAHILGAWIFSMEPVRLRLVLWHNEPDGTKLFERLVRAINLGIRASRGQARLPVEDPAWYPFKRDTVAELRALQSRLRTKFGAHHCLPSIVDFCGLVEQEIQQSVAAFPRLLENLTAFLRFLEQNEETARLFLLGQIRPPKFFDEFAGWSTNRDPEKLRQMISGLGTAHQ